MNKTEHLLDRDCNSRPVSAGIPSVSRNRDAYQSIDQQDESSSPANPFNQAQDSKPGARTYWEKQAVFSLWLFYVAVRVLRDSFHDRFQLSAFVLYSRPAAGCSTENKIE